MLVGVLYVLSLRASLHGRSKDQAVSQKTIAVVTKPHVPAYTSDTHVASLSTSVSYGLLYPGHTNAKLAFCGIS